MIEHSRSDDALEEFFLQIPHLDFSPNKIELTVLSDHAFQATTSESYEQERIARSINGDVVSESESDDPDQYIGIKSVTSAQSQGSGHSLTLSQSQEAGSSLPVSQSQGPGHSFTLSQSQEAGSLLPVSQSQGPGHSLTLSQLAVQSLSLSPREGKHNICVNHAMLEKSLYIRNL